MAKIYYKTSYEQETQIDIRTWLCGLFKVCEMCENTDNSVHISHRNTAYINDSQNYASFCESCRKEDNEYYQELWNDYNSNIIAGLYG